VLWVLGGGGGGGGSGVIGRFGRPHIGVLIQ